MNRNPNTRWLMPLCASLVLSACGGSSTQSSAYEQPSEPSASGGEGVEAEADMADDVYDGGGEAMEPAMGSGASTGMPPGTEPVPAPAREPGVRPTVRHTVQPRQLGGDGTDGTDAYQRLVQASIDLDQATTLARVDCPSARDLRDQICELSTRICEISEDHPDDQPTEERCRDGRARCRGASDRVAQSCP